MDQKSQVNQDSKRTMVDGLQNNDVDCELRKQDDPVSMPAELEYSGREDVLSDNGHNVANKKKVWLPLNYKGPVLPHGGKKRRENNRRFHMRHALTPWIRRKYYPSILGLHEEIEDFYNYMRPADCERRMRNHVIKAVEEVVLHLWPNAKVDVFGSFRTDLYLPTSDIDMVVFGKWETLPMERLKEELIKNGVAEADSVKVLDRAAVPIIKFQHTNAKVKVDISFNMKSGVQSVDLVKSFLKKFPVLPKLMMVLKQFLLLKDLNEVWTGGLSSYSLLLMCVSFLQLSPRRDCTNLGILLICFFELYGFYFNYDTTCIRVKDGGCYISKEEFRKQLDNGSAPSLLCIEDPLTRGNDLGKGSYAMLRIKQLFQWAFHTLLSSTRMQNCDSDSPPTSYLSFIVNVPGSVIEIRQKACESFSTAELPLVRCSSYSSAGSHGSSTEVSAQRPACLTSEGYSSSSSSTESDLDDRLSAPIGSLRNPPCLIYRARSCDSLCPPHNGVRKLRHMHTNRHPVRMHSADNNVIHFTTSMQSRFNGAGEPGNQFMSSAKTSYVSENPRLAAGESNGSENFSKNRCEQFPKKSNKVRTNGSPSSNRGRSTGPRMQILANGNRKYSNIQRNPNSFNNICRLER